MQRVLLKSSVVWDYAKWALGRTEIGISGFDLIKKLA